MLVITAHRKEKQQDPKFKIILSYMANLGQAWDGGREGKRERGREGETEKQRGETERQEGEGEKKKSKGKKER